jgi:type I restriction enzyme, S subunit
VPRDLDEAIVSNDFPVFELNQDRLLPQFLGWLSRTGPFVERCQRASEGTTNRVRISEDRFLAIEISLPPLLEQLRVVAWVEELAANIRESRLLQGQILTESDALTVSTHLGLSGTRTRRLGQIRRLDEDLLAIVPNEFYPQVGIKSFGAGLFRKSAVSGADTTYKGFNRLYEGAVVLSQVKGWEGAVAVCGPEFAGWFASPEYRTFRCDPNEARPSYLDALVGTHWFWSQLVQATRGVGARRERTRPEQFVAIEIPMPEL